MSTDPVSESGSQRTGQSALLAQAFSAFDAACCPPPAGEAALATLAPWFAFLSSQVEFQAGNEAALIGHAAVASYFDPLLPALSAVAHELLTISPVAGHENAWTVRGILKLTRRRDGKAIRPIPFTDTMFFDREGRLIEKYEVRFDPSPIAELFAAH